MKINPYRLKTASILFITQVAFLILFAFCTEYGDTGKPGLFNQTQWTPQGPTLEQYYPMFQDVHVMIFLGIGFLLTFLKRYSYTGVGLNFLIGALMVQWSALVAGFINREHADDKIKIDILTMTLGDFAAAVVLISYCTVLGKLSPLQCLLMGLIEIPVYHANEYLGLEILKVADVGGSILIHAFAAYFGLAVARVTYKHRVAKESHKQESVYHSDLFCLIGTIFLWLFWPSFNGIMASGDGRYRATMHTYYAMAASCVTSYFISTLVDKKGRFSMVHVQNATLAGGVGVGAVANLVMQPWGAICLGMVAAAISSLGFSYLTPWMDEKFGIHDTCGVHNLHVLPAAVSTAASAVLAALATEDVYGPSLYRLYPALIPENNTTALYDLSMRMNDLHLEPGLGRSGSRQAGFQLIAFLVTMAVSAAAGVLAGFILRIPIWHEPGDGEVFEDFPYWIIPESEDCEDTVKEVEFKKLETKRHSSEQCAV